jgi:hypothetical protein
VIRGALAVIAIAAAASSAGASPTKVFPLGGSADRAGDRDAIAEALATALGAETAAVAIDDAAGVLGCSVDEASCLDAIARSLAAETLVFGEVSERSGRVRVALTRHVRGGSSARAEFDADGAGPGDRAAALLRAAGAFLELPPSTDEDPPPPDTAVLPDAPAPAPAPRSRRGIPRYVWGVIGGGVVIAGVGGGFLLSARSLRDDVANAPTATREDFDRLTALEATGRRRTRIGGALAIAGAAVAITGVVLAIVHGRGGDDDAREKPDATALRVEPALVPGGAMVVLSIEAP